MTRKEALASDFTQREPCKGVCVMKILVAWLDQYYFLAFKQAGAPTLDHALLFVLAIIVMV